MAKGMFTKGQKQKGERTYSLNSDWCSVYCSKCGTLPFDQMTRRVVTKWERLANQEWKRTQTIIVDCLVCKQHAEKVYTDYFPAHLEIGKKS